LEITIIKNIVISIKEFVVALIAKLMAKAITLIEPVI